MVAVVAHVPAAVPDPPGELDALVGVPERVRPAVGVRRTPPAGSPPHPPRPTWPGCCGPGRWPAAGASTGAAPGGRRGRPPAAAPDPGSDRYANSCGELGQHGRGGQPGVVVEEEQQVAVDQRHPGVAAGGDAEVRRAARGRGPRRGVRSAASRCRPPRRPGPRPAVPAATPARAADRRPLAHGQHDDAVAGSGRHRAGHRSLGELEHRGQVADHGDRRRRRTSPISSHCVATPPSQRSSTAATRINSDSSTEWKTRWNGTKRATRRAVRSRPPAAACGPPRRPASAADRRSAGTRARGRSPPC